jgi:spore germination protein GerM
VLIAGPTESDAAAGLTTAIAPSVSILSFAIDGDNATVDFNRAFETADTQPQVAQVVYTLTQFAGLNTVTFLIDGEPNGATGVRPLDKADVRRDLAPVGG